MRLSHFLFEPYPRHGDHPLHRPGDGHGARHLHGLRGGRVGHHEATATQSLHGQARQRAAHIDGLRPDRDDTGRGRSYGLDVKEKQRAVWHRSSLHFLL